MPSRPNPEKTSESPLRTPAPSQKAEPRVVRRFSRSKKSRSRINPNISTLRHTDEQPHQQGIPKGWEIAPLPKKQDDTSGLLMVIFGLTALGAMTNALVIPALPEISADFNVGPTALAAFVTAGAFPAVILAPASGFMAQRFGRHVTIAPFVGLFAVGSFVTIIAPTFALILIGRLIMGLGAGPAIGMAIVLIGDSWTGPQRVRLIGLNAAAFTILLALYPLIGGLLASAFGYRSVFLPCLVGFPLASFSWQQLKKHYESTHNPDEYRIANSVKDEFATAIQALAKPQVLSTAVTGFVTFTIIFGAQLIVFPLLAEEKFGYGVATRGVLLALAAAASALAGVSLAWMQRLFSSKDLVVLGAMAAGVGFSMIGGTSSQSMLIAALLIFGFGQGLLLPTLQTVASNVAKPNARAVVVSSFIGVLAGAQTVGGFAATTTASILGNDRLFILAGSLLALSSLSHFLLPQRSPYALPNTVHAVKRPLSRQNKELKSPRPKNEQD